jgi:hypothetical protein
MEIHVEDNAFLTKTCRRSRSITAIIYHLINYIWIMTTKEVVRSCAIRGSVGCLF